MGGSTSTFIDEVKVSVRAGDGGDGCRSFLREKYRPKGGPDGGDGGAGGSVVLFADPHKSTLLDFHYRHHFKAPCGERGRGSAMHGRAGEDLILNVPVGTMVSDADGKPLGDLVEAGQRLVVASGGAGGRGNTRFVTSTRRAPAFAEKGEPGEEREIVLELKLLADIGLVGYPNAGKSTLIAAMSAARPKIADYPFTTLTPHLGVVGSGEDSFVIADVPGLIEGAHKGAGLGHGFLRHVERCAALVIVVDASGLEGRDPLADFRIVLGELEAHAGSLARRPRLVALNKVDLEEARTAAPALTDSLEGEGERVFVVSGASHEGLERLIRACASLVEATRTEGAASAAAAASRPPRVYAAPQAHAEPFRVARDDDGAWRVYGKDVERMVTMTDLENDEAVAYLQKRLAKTGVERALTRAGARAGETVRIARAEFDFVPLEEGDTGESEAKA